MKHGKLIISCTYPDNATGFLENWFVYGSYLLYQRKVALIIVMINKNPLSLLDMGNVFSLLRRLVYLKYNITQFLGLDYWQNNQNLGLEIVYLV